jgi:hypothetical protein
MIHGRHDMTPTWDAGSLPVITMRLAAVRLGRGRGEGLGLTQGGGNQSQEDGGACNDLHFDFAGCAKVTSRVYEWSNGRVWERAVRAGGYVCTSIGAVHGEAQKEGIIYAPCGVPTW